MRNKKQRRRERIRSYWVLIGFNINWPKYLFSRIFSLSRANSSEKNRLTRCFCKHRVHTDCFTPKRGEDSKEREREKYTLSKGYYY